MTRTWINISKRLVFVYLLLGGCIFLFLPTRMTGKLQLIYAHLFRVPLTAGRALTLATRTVTTMDNPRAQEYDRLLAEYRLLENKYANLESQLNAAHDKIDELAGLRVKPEWSGMGFLQAGVMTDPALGQNELFIGRGQEDGVTVGQYVMADFSIIGKVSAVAPKTARIQLITDPTCKIQVQIAGSNVRGIMAGRRDGTVEIAQVRLSQPVKIGDAVLALNIPGAPEVSIIAAKVTGCTRAKEPLVWDISVRPVCDIVNLKSVIVLVPRK